MRVLMVDDAADMRLLVRAWLEQAGGFEVVGEAGDGKEAIDLAAEYQPDMIVLDGVMPVLSGLDALPELRDRAPAARIVMFSSAREQRTAALAAGAAAYVDKNDGGDALVSALRGGSTETTA